MKKPKSIIKLKLIANKASPSPVLGQSLGQYGINIMDFCKKFNSSTKNLKDGLVVPLNVIIYSQTDYNIIIKTPATSYLIKKVANIEKGSSSPKKENFKENQAFLLAKEIYHLGIFKKCESKLNHLSNQSICKSISSTVKSIGIPILNNYGNN